MEISREECIEINRKRVAELAIGMIAGSINYLEGALELSSLRFNIDVPENDSDFLIFSGIASEIDHLPIGPSRNNWSKEALERYESEMQIMIEWAKAVSLSSCRSIVARFNDA